MGRAKRKILRTARDRIILRNSCDIFNEGENGLPDGWVEIQRHDSLDTEPCVRFETDEDAAREVCRVGDAPGTALLFNKETGASMMLRDEEGGTTEVLAPVREALENAVDDQAPGALPKWIVIVPLSVAKRAGLR